MSEDGPPLAQELLHRALSPDEAAIFRERVINRPLFVRLNSPQPSARALRRRTLNEKKDKARKQKKLKPRPLSAAKKRQLGLLEIPKEQAKWSIYLPLHNLWLGYMRDILSLEGETRNTYVMPQGSGPIVASADMHGALLEVVRSRCVSRVGLKGIVVRDSQFVFELVTEGDELKSVPKEHTLFRFTIPLPEHHKLGTGSPLVFEINGEQFQHKAPDRANRKYKMHYQPDL